MRYFLLALMFIALPAFAQETNVTVTPGAAKTASTSKTISIEGLWRSDSGLAQAEKLLSENKYSDALTLLDQVIARNPRTADAYVDSAYAWLNLGNNQKAQTAVDNALLINKNHMGAYVINGLLALAQKDRAQAENYLQVIHILCQSDNCPEFQTLQRIIRETKPDQS